MYLEFFILVADYFKTLSRRIVLYEIVTPFLFAIIVCILIMQGMNTSICKKFIENSLTLLGILVGFSITIITILTTGNSRNLQAIKNKTTQHEIGGKRISLFDLLLINFTYSVVIEICLIIFLLLAPVFLSNIQLSKQVEIIGFSLVVGAVIHVLLLMMRNLTDFYLILLKK